MEERAWKAVREIIRRHASRKSTREDFADADIVEAFYWAVVHDRPQGWATARENWPIHLRRARRFPSQGTLSRRLRSPRVRALLQRIEEEVLRWNAAASTALVHYVDGKPLTVSRCSQDRQSGYGWGAGGKAKGYKIHVLLGENGTISAWRLTPMSTSEKVMARRLIRAVKPQGYVIGDGNYDDRHLHEQCAAQGELQWVAPRSKPGAGLGHRPKSPGRLRSIELLENSRTGFGPDLLRKRTAIERRFGWTVSYGGGLTCLPAWVRSYLRVHRWVSAKLVLSGLRIRDRKTLYVTT